MGTHENATGAGELSRALVPGIGLGAAMSLIRFDLPLWGVLVAVAAFGVLALTHPQFLRGGGTEQRTLSSADHTRSELLAPFIVPGVTMLASFALEPTSVEPVIAAPATFLAMTATSTWALLRASRRERLLGRRRAAAALEKAPFGEATASRIAAVSSPDARSVLGGLSRIGAVDGIQVRLWRLAKAVDTDIDHLYTTCRELEKIGIVRVSGIDSGPDKPRTLVELTPVGVRTLRESRSR